MVIRVRLILLFSLIYSYLFPLSQHSSVYFLSACTLHIVLQAESLALDEMQCIGKE